MPLLRLALAAFVLSPVTAQACLRPLPPPTGHPWVSDLVVPVGYSDGYQTFGTLIRPAVAPPSCGWPLVVFVHPLGQLRSDDLPLQIMLAGLGYAVWSYDVRGHGQALLANTGHPNAGSTLWGAIERCDLAEQIRFAGSQPQWAGVVDGTRTAVVGSSQGGVHAWNAAAWSGLPLAVPGRAATTFPDVLCVVANDYVAEPIDDWLRGDLLWSSWFLEALAGSYAGLPIDAAFLQTARAAFTNQDPAALLAAFVAEGRPIRTNLQASLVPVLYSHAYHDRIDSPLATLRLLQGSNAPHRVMLSTVGHNTPVNLAERQFRDGIIARWLHRYLWAEANEVDLEAPFVLSELPLVSSVRDDPNHAWSRSHGGDPLPTGNATRFYLHDDLVLRDVPPSAPQLPLPLVQTIDPQATTFTPADYLATASVRDLTNVLTVCPLHEQVHTTTIAVESELATGVGVHLRLVPQHADWLLAVLLTVEAPAAVPEEVMLTSHAIASASSVPGTAEEHDFVLPPVAARIPAGAIVRLRLRNLWLREAPMARALEVTPRFHDFQVDVVPGDPATGGSWLDLPLAPVRPKLATPTTWFPLAQAPAIPISLRGGVARAGAPYYVTAGISGHLPATPFLNDVLPLESDWIVGIVTGAISQPEFQGFLGSLDGNGNASIALNFSPYAPLPPELTGLRLSFAAFVWDDFTGVSGAASNPCDVFLQ
jgi:hypothetical protein